jgi:predicted deacylase
MTKNRRRWAQALAGVLVILIASVLGWGLRSQSANQYLFGRPLEYEMIHSDSGIERRPLETIHADFASLANNHGDSVDWIEYGRSGRNKPLMALRVMNRIIKGQENRPAIMISEAIHGNEYLHITDRLPFEFLTAKQTAPEFNQFIASGGVVYFIPIMNPDGYAAGQRGNSAGADLNRDFSIQAAGNQGFRQPETQAITNFIASEARKNQLTFEATMEYHCCIGGLIHPWAWTSEGLTGTL